MILITEISSGDIEDFDILWPLILMGKIGNEPYQDLIDMDATISVHSYPSPHDYCNKIRFTASFKDPHDQLIYTLKHFPRESQ